MFNAKRSGISFVHGRFIGFEVESGRSVDFIGTRISFKAQVCSISNCAEYPDEHLKTLDFLT